MHTESQLQPTATGRLAQTKSISRKLLALHPGLGSGAWKHAEVLADSGLSPAQATMILTAIYAPATGSNGSGQSNRAREMVQALRDRYADRLQRVSNNLALFKQFVAEIEDMVSTRADLNESGSCTFSFHEVFACDEVGLSGDDISRLMEEQDAPRRTTRKARLMAAVKLVRDGKCATVDGALWQVGSDIDED